MADCRKCKGNKSNGRLSTHFFYNPNHGIKSATITVAETRVLYSNITRVSVRMGPNVSYVVYVSDLHEWIKRGVFGIRFINANEEADFLATYTDIRQADYA